MSVAEPVRVGVFGGTFDPPHKGHLAVARAARDQLALDTLVLMPAGQPWQKINNASMSTWEERMDMVRLAVRHEARMIVSGLANPEKGNTYDVDTARALRKEYGDRIELWWVMGADTLRGIPTWHNWDSFVQLVKLAVVARPGENFADAQATLRAAAQGEGLPQLSISTVAVKTPDISSRAIRKAVAEKRLEAPLSFLDAEVVRYIREHRLYLTS